MQRHRCFGRRAPVLLLAVLAGGPICGCTVLHMPAAVATACPRGLPECPIEVRFAAGSGARSATLSGHLDADRANVSYFFIAEADDALAWRYSGPAVRLVLTHPNGDVDGPDLPNTVPLPVGGRYVLSVASNTMAENIYGGFRLELHLAARGR